MKEVTDRLPHWEFHLVCASLSRGLPRNEKIGNVYVHRVGLGFSFDKYLLPILGLIRAWRLERSGEFFALWSLMASYGGFASLLYSYVHPRVPFLLTLQEGDPLDHYAKRVGVLGVFHRAIFRRAKRVQAISAFLAAWSKQMGFKGEPIVIPNGVHIAHFSQPILSDVRNSIRGEWGVRAGEHVLITTSRLSKKNGIDTVIQALPLIDPSWKFVIVGEGEDRPKLEGLIQQLNLSDRVVMLGLRSHDELPKLLGSADVFIRASRSEGLGNSFLEAMAAGLPIIGTPVGGIPDFLKDGETGVFCEADNPESIAKAVQMLEDQERRRRIIQKGIACVQGRYEWSVIAKTIESIFDSFNDSQEKV